MVGQSLTCERFGPSTTSSCRAWSYRALFDDFSRTSSTGIDAENLEGDFGNYFGAPDGEGVLVRGVFANSVAAKAGLRWAM